MPKTVRVNIRTRVNAAEIVHEKRDGRDVIRVPSATLPDNVVMNGILYPADEIAKSFRTLERTPAPLGHPMIGNQYVSAREPEAINGYWVGAWNENVRRKDGRVYLDKVIDVEFASRTEKGKALIEAINKGDPVHTSTGVLVEVEPTEGDGYTGIARNMVFDHDAILLGQEGAATPAQGVGMLVNAKGEEEEIEAMDVDLDADDLEQIAKSVADTIGWRIEQEEREERFKSLTAKIMDLLKSSIGKLTATNMAPGLKPNHHEEDDMTKDEVKAAITEALAANAKEQATSIGEAVAAAVTAANKPLLDTVAQLQANAKAQEEAEKAELVEKVVKANLLDEAAAKELSVNVLKQLATKIPPTGPAAGVFSAYAANNEQDEAAKPGSFLENLKAAGGDK